MIDNINVKHKKYVPVKDESQYSKRSSLLTVVLFLLAGCASSFSLEDGICLCELAWFEGSQPEGIYLESFFVLMQAAGGVICLCLMYIETKMIWSKRMVLYVCSVVTVLTSILVAFAWNFTVNGTSLFLMLGMLASTIVGYLQFIMVIPWLLRNYNGKLMSPFFAGHGFMLFILVTMEIIQEPGGSQTFSPTVYFLIAGVCYVASVGACVYTVENGIGRITPEEGVLQTLKPWQTNIWLQFFPVGWRKGIRYAVIRIWIDLLMFWVVPIILPFAAVNTTSSSANSGENYLQWATAVSLLGLLIGPLCSYLACQKFWINESVGLITMLTTIIFLAAANIGNWRTWTMQGVLMAAIAVSYILYGWTIPLLVREIKLKFPENSEEFARFFSLWVLVFSVFVKTLMWWLVYSGIIS